MCISCKSWQEGISFLNNNVLTKKVTTSFFLFLKNTHFIFILHDRPTDMSVIKNITWIFSLYLWNARSMSITKLMIGITGIIIRIPTFDDTNDAKIPVTQYIFSVPTFTNVYMHLVKSSYVLFVRKRVSKRSSSVCRWHCTAPPLPCRFTSTLL